MKKHLCSALLALLAPLALAIERFPPPDFESGYQMPATRQFPARAAYLAWLDIGVLCLGLALAAWLVHRRRSRRGIVWLGLGAIAYFGFYRQGCICPIGAIQNVSLALADSSYVLTLPALAFFVLPLLAALVWGRVFCAAVCPHGALQDVLLLRPVKLPAWLEHGLRTVPFIYLAAGILLAASGSAFIICRYDPFIGLFRLAGPTPMLVFGGILLALSLFIGRPYCRYLCPYGALLSLASHVSRFRVSVTPDTCSKCHLCRDACPFDAIEPPAPTVVPAPLDRRRLLLVLAAAPLLIAATGWAGNRLAGALAVLDPIVQTEHRLQAQAAGAQLTDVPEIWPPPHLQTEQIQTAAAQVRRRLQIGGWWLGAGIGVVLLLKLLRLSIYRRRDIYAPSDQRCLGCARCFMTCPYELVRRGHELDLATLATEEPQ